MQELGVWFDFRQKWMDHVREIGQKILKLINGLKIIREKMNLKQTVVTSQVFPTLYHASPVWLTLVLGKHEVKEVEKLHFKALPIVVCDFKQRTNCKDISRKTNCLLPKL